MASQQPAGFCEQHGPYDASNPSCPYCAIEQKSEGNTRTRGHLHDPFGDAPTSLDNLTPGQSNQRHIPGVEPATELQSQPRRDSFADRTMPPDRLQGINEHTMPSFNVIAPRMYLIIKSPLKYRGRVLLVNSGQTIGRKGADVLVHDPEMTEQHARLRIEQDDESSNLKFVIFDSGSTNGTFVNGKMVPGRLEINENDEIRLGGHVFVFKVLIP